MQDTQIVRPLGRVLLTGATGMVGSAVLRALLHNDTVSHVVSLARRPSGMTHPKLTDVVFTAFDNADAITPHLTDIDTVFHCLATYATRVDRAAYEEITVGWLSALLRACEATAPQATFCLFSAQGARPDGGGLSFALRIKGQAETALFASPLARKFAFRPGYIAPSNDGPGWKPADYLFKPLHRLLPSIGVTSDELAQAMLQTATTDTRASAVLENSDLRALLA